MTESKKVSRVDDAHERLRKEILENRLPPGFQAPESEIALRLGMSRTPVREALLKLESEGLVELIPRRGARILPVSTDDMREIYEILTALEAEAAALLATKQLSKKKLQGLEKACDEMEKALAKNDLESWASADSQFHRRLLELHGNKRLSSFVKTMWDQAHRARMITLRLRETPTVSTQEHREILTCIQQGNAEKARKAFRKHRERTAKELLAILESFNFSSL